MEFSYEQEVRNSKKYEQISTGTEYLASERSEDRATVYWSSRLDLLKTLTIARNTLGDPIEHMNGRAIFRDPSTERAFLSDHRVPVVHRWATAIPEQVNEIQLPYPGMAVAWARVPEELRDTMKEPVQIRLTAEQHIARTAIYRMLIETATPAIAENVDTLLAGLAYDLRPLRDGELYKSDEWHTMHHEI
jgi:hypothetical protein